MSAGLAGLGHYGLDHADAKTTEIKLAEASLREGSGPQKNTTCRRTSTQQQTQQIPTIQAQPPKSQHSLATFLQALSLQVSQHTHSRSIWRYARSKKGCDMSERKLSHSQHLMFSTGHSMTPPSTSSHQVQHYLTRSFDLVACYL